MKRLLIALLFLLGFGASARAQSGMTAVSAQVLDPTGAIYANCAGSAAFVPSPSATQVPTISGSVFPTTAVISGCNSFGQFTLSLADNNQVTDGHTGSPASQWNFAINSQDGKTGFNCTITITGATQNITTQLQACAAPLPAQAGGGGAFIYKTIPCANSVTFTMGGISPTTANTAFAVALNCNVATSSVVGNPNIQTGATAQFVIVEDGTGTKTFAWPANFLNPPTITSGPNKETDAAFIFDGTNWHPTTFPASGGGGANPAGTSGDVQINNGAGGLAASSINDSAGVVTVGEPSKFNANVTNKGPNPAYDITAYGARAVYTQPQTTATMGAGSVTATLAGASTFQNGDGVVIYGAGATNTLATPGAPTVVPSQTAGPTGIGVVVSSAAAATTYNYQIVAVTKNGAVTAASTVGTTATGAAALGDNSVSITSISRTNNTSTVTCAATCAVAVGSIVYVSGTSDNTFHGFFVVSAVTDGTHFAYTQGQDTRAGASTAATGGTLHWYVCNHITWTAVTNAWKYYIYGRTGGALTLIGVTKVLDPVWDDYGATMEGGTTFPSWVPNTPPVSATNEWLSTTISSGAGTTTVTLANTATNAVAGATFLFDDAPGFYAAALAANGNGTIRIPTPATPTTYYYINSYLTLPNVPTTIEQNGALLVNETIQTPSSFYWNGKRGGTLSVPSFAQTPAQQINGAGNPMIYSPGSGGTNFDHVIFQGNMGNQQNLMMLDIAVTFSCDYCAFISGTSNSDYMGIGFIARGDFSFMFHNSLISGGSPFATGSTLTPGALFRKRIGDSTAGANFLFENSWVNARGIAQDYTGAGGGINFVQMKYVQTQSLRTPLLMYSGQGVTGQTYLEGITPADFSTPVVANWSNQGGIEVVNSTPPAGGMSFVTGNLIPGLSFFNSSVTTATAGQNREVLINSESVPMNGGPFITGGLATNLGNLEMRQQMHFPAGNTLFWDGAQMAAPTCAVAAGGSVPVGTWTYEVSPVWQDGGEGLLSPPSSGCTTSSGNQTINVNWTAIAGVQGYNLYRSNGGGYARVNQAPTSGPQFTTTSFSDIYSFTSGITSPQVAGGGPVSIGPNGFKSSQAGTFTNTQMNESLPSLLNSVNLTTENQAVQGANAATDAIAGGSLVGSGSTVQRADSLAGYIQNSSTTTAAVGIYGQARNLANNVNSWGANFVCQVESAVTGSGCIGNEIDLNNKQADATDAQSNPMDGLRVINGSTFKSRFGIWVNASTANWQEALKLSNFQTFGLNIQNGASASNAIQIVPPDNTAATEVIGRNAANNATVWSLTNSGIATFVELHFLSTNATNYAGFKGGASTTNLVWLFPTTDSSGTQCLSSNGSLQLSWSACSAGTGTPGGSLHNVQYQGAGSTFAGSNALNFDGTNTLSIGVVNTTLGVLQMFGNTSGTITIQPQAAAGTATLTLPNTTGTLAAGASAPLSLSATTGNLTCATCTTNAAALTANQLVIGGGGQAAATLGSLGTTTTVLHGNAAGAPTFAAVSLVNDVTGVCVIASGCTGQSTAGAAFNALSPITSTGDLIVGTGVNTAGRLAIGANGLCLVSNGATAAWNSCAAGAVGGTGTAGQGTFWSSSSGVSGSANWLYSAASGHTVIQGANAADAFYMRRFTDTSPTGNFLHFQNAAANTDLFKVDVTGAASATSLTLSGTCNGGTAGCFILTQGTAPSITASSSITFYAPAGVTDYRVAFPGSAATGFVRWTNSAGTVTESISAASGVGSCTNQVVTAVNDNSIPTCGPVTGAMFGTQVANVIWAGPSSGGAANPTFRSLVSADIPAINLGAGGNGGVTGVLALSNGGCNATTASACYNNISPMSTLGDIEYEGTGPTGARLAGNTTTTKMYLSQTGTGTVSAAPAWAQVAFADISGTVGIGAGGTGQTTAGAAFNALAPAAAAANYLLYSSGVNTWASLAPGGAGTLCLTETAGGTPGWNSCTGGAGAAWSALTNPSGNLALSMAANTTTFTWGAATGAATDMFKITDTASNTGTGFALNINLASGSAAKPFQAAVNGNGFSVSNTGVVAKVGTGSITADTVNLSVNTSAPLSGGGALTSTLTLTCATCVTSGGSLANNAVVVGSGGGQGTASKSYADLTTNAYAAGGGTAQAQTVTLAPAATALTAGLVVSWLPVAANSGAGPTLAVNGLTAKTITKLGTAALVANDLTTTAVAVAIYDGTQFQLQNPQTSAAGGVTAWSGDGSVYTNSSSTGAVTATLGTQAAKSVFVGPRFGSAVAPSFVASPSPVYTFDPTNWLYFFDDFQCLINNTNGCLGWVMNSGTYAHDLTPTGTGTVYGVDKVTTGAVSGNPAQLWPGSANGGVDLYAVNAATGDIYIRVAFNSTTTTSHFVGMSVVSTCGSSGGEGCSAAIGIGFDTTQGDTHSMCVTRSASTSTRTSLADTVDGNFHTYHIRFANGTIGCQIDGGTEVTQSTNVPTVKLTPAINLNTRTAAAQVMEVDYYWLGLSMSR